MSPHKPFRAVRLALVLLAVASLVLASALWLRGEQRRFRLNRELIAVLVNQDGERALQLVNSGADPNTRYLAPAPPTFITLWNNLIHPATEPATENPTALLIVCGAWLPDGTRNFDLVCPALLEAMLQHGADIHVTDEFKQGALFFASQKDRSLCAILLRWGARVDQRDSEGRTPLWYVRDSVETADLLLQHGADVNARDKRGRTPLMDAVEGSVTASSGMPEFLLAHGADVNARDNDGNTALILGTDNYFVVRLLIAHGADVNTRNQAGLTPLLCTLQNPASLRALVDHGANVNVRSNDGSTPLLEEVDSSDLESAQFLLDHGADPNACCSADGETPLAMARRKHDTAMIALLEHYTGKK